MIAYLYKRVFVSLFVVIVAQWGLSATGQTAKFTTEDKLHGYVGVLEGPARFTPLSRSGNLGDFAIDFWPDGGASGLIRVTNVAFLNTAATKDILSVSFWQKRYDIAASTTLWMTSPTASEPLTEALGRAFAAHIPWDDSTIYFDTGGCCDPSTQRIAMDIKTFPDYAVVGNDTWWQQWHHFVLLKNASEKQVWINGQLFLQGTSSNPLPNDISELLIGNNSIADAITGGFHGLVDDFAVFSTALSAASIRLLFNGTLPTDITSETLEAYWDFNDSFKYVHPARATARIVDGRVIGTIITDRGYGYTNAPAVVIEGDGSGAIATATIREGMIDEITIESPGQDYALTTTRILIASPAFTSEVSIQVSKVKLRQKVVLGRVYQLEASVNATSWTPVGSPFSANRELLEQEFDVNETGRYFRLKEIQ